MHVDLDAILDDFSAWNLTVKVGGRDLVTRAPNEWALHAISEVSANLVPAERQRKHVQEAVQDAFDTIVVVADFADEELIAVATAILAHARMLRAANSSQIGRRIMDAMLPKKPKPTPAESGDADRIKVEVADDPILRPPEDANAKINAAVQSSFDQMKANVASYAAGATSINGKDDVR